MSQSDPSHFINPAELANLTAGVAPAQPQVQQGPFEGQHVEGEEAYLTDAQGELYKVPAQNVGLALEENPGLRPASSDEVFDARRRKNVNPLEAAGKELAASTLRGAGWAANTVMGAANLLGADVRPSTTEEYRAGANALWAAMTGQDMQEAYDESLAAQELEHQAFPTLMATTRIAGDILGMGLSGGLSAGGAARGMAARAGVGRLGQAGAAVAGETLEGAVQSGLTAYDDINNPPDRERVLASMGMGALLASSLGVGIRGAGAGLEKAAKHLPDSNLLRSVFGEPKLNVKSYEKLVSEGVEPKEALARVLGRDVTTLTDDEVLRAGQVIEAAGQARKVPRITSENFDQIDNANVTDVAAAAYRDQIEEGAAKSFRRDLDDVFNKSFEATEQLRKLPLKEELVAKNLAADGIDDLKARSAVGARLGQMGSAFEDMVTSLPTFGGKLEKKAKKAVEDLHFVLEQAQVAFKNAGEQGAGAAGGYIALDRLRRQMLEKIPGFEGMARKTSDPRLAAQGAVLNEVVEREYRALAEFLFDEGIWGRQGAAQRRVNKAFVQMIPENRIAVQNFAKQIGEEIGGRPKYAADPDKIKQYLRTLGKDSLQDEGFRRYIDAQAELMEAAQAGYQLSGATRRQMAEVANAVAQLKKTLDKSEDLLIRGNEGAKALSDGTATQGVIASLAGHTMGGFLGGAGAGAFAGGQVAGKRGAVLGGIMGLIPGGGYSSAVKLAQKARGFADQTDSAIVDSVASFLERTTGLAGGKLPRLGKFKPPELNFRGPGGLVGPWGRLSDDTKERKESFRAKREWLAQNVGNPAALERATKTALHGVTEASPALAANLSLEYQTKLENLKNDWPRTKELSLVKSKAYDDPSIDDVERAEAMWTATFQPLAIFEDFKRGKVNYDQVKYVWKQYPELQRIAQAGAIDLLQGMPDDSQIPDEAITSLDLFLGFGGQLDKSLSPEFMKVMASSAQQANQDTQKEPSPRPQNANFARLSSSFTDRLAGNA